MDSGPNTKTADNFLTAEFPAMDDRMCVAASDTQCTRFGETPRYKEGLYDIGNRCYAWMVPNGSWGESNAGLIVGDGESLLVDTLWDLKYTRTMLAAMQPLMEDAPLKYVINTHSDGDHFWGNELVADAEIIASQACYDELLDIKPGSMALFNTVGKLFSAIRVLGFDRVGHWFQNMVKPYDFQEVTLSPATRTFDNELELNIGGHKVQLIEVGPAHTQGDVIVYVPEAKTLYSGDIVFIGSTPAMWAGPIENWLTALDRILDMDIDIIVPGHGPITDKKGVRQVSAYLGYIKKQVRKRFDDGMSAKDAAYDIVLGDDYAKQPFADWNSPERIMTNAHVIYRNLSGRTSHLKVHEKINMFRNQALLAHELPDAQPKVMRKPL